MGQRGCKTCCRQRVRALPAVVALAAVKWARCGASDADIGWVRDGEERKARPEVFARFIAADRAMVDYLYASEPALADYADP